MTLYKPLYHNRNSTLGCSPMLSVSVTTHRTPTPIGLEIFFDSGSGKPVIPYWGLVPSLPFLSTNALPSVRPAVPSICLKQCFLWIRGTGVFTSPSSYRTIRDRIAISRIRLDSILLTHKYAAYACSSTYLSRSGVLCVLALVHLIFHSA
jgi:hypothetical protein